MAKKAWVLVSAVLVAIAFAFNNCTPPLSSLIIKDFEFETIAPNTLAFHDGFDYMQAHVVADDLPFSQIGGYKLLIRNDQTDPHMGTVTKTHTPYQDNFCNVNAEPLGAGSLFTVICSRQESKSAGGYMLPTTARLVIRKNDPKLTVKDFTFGTIVMGTTQNTVPMHVGFNYMQEHVVVEDLPYDDIAGFQLLVREDLPFPGGETIESTHEPFLDNYCHIQAEPLDAGSMFTVICSRQTSQSAGGYMMPDAARLVVTRKAPAMTLRDFTFDTIELGTTINTVPMHVGYNYMQEFAEFTSDLPYDQIGDYQLVFPQVDDMPPGMVHMSLSEPYQDNYCTMHAEPLEAGSLLYVVCNRQTSNSAGGYMLPSDARLVINRK